MREGLTELAARKQLLLARSTLYRLRLRADAAHLRQSLTRPSTAFSFLKVAPLALVGARLLLGSRARGFAGVFSQVIRVASVVAAWLVARRARKNAA